MHIEGEQIRLRAVEPEDIDLMYRWENNSAVWRVSGTLVPFSRHTLQRFLDEQQYDLLQTRQQRLIIETHAGEAVGALDLFELDLLNSRAGIGILIHDTEQQGKGYATDAVATICRYAHEVLGLHQLWCQVGITNAASRALFTRCGFVEAGCLHDWLRTPDGWEDEVILQKLL
ncbi:MAG: GNAT family N-acetyltransferase [Alistipes sp.]|nr:GNAT family N-acetyltransferase [Alistipes sp.]